MLQMPQSLPRAMTAVDTLMSQHVDIIRANLSSIKSWQVSKLNLFGKNADILLLYNNYTDTYIINSKKHHNIIRVFM